GLFWPRATARGALAAAIGSAVLSFACKVWWPELPFMDRVGLVFVACLVLAVGISLADTPKSHPDAVPLKDIDFKTSPSFNFAAMATVLILAALYITWW